MICVSVAERKIKDVISTLELDADLFEIRLDALEETEVSNLHKIFQRTKRPLLFTYRAKEEGGYKTVPTSKRIYYLKQAANLGAHYVDIELFSGPEAILELKTCLKTTKLIISYHNFTSTPNKEYLKEKIREMAHLGADIGKVVCYTKTHLDVINLLNLIPWAKEYLDLPLIAFGMGPKGKWSRIVCLFLGSPFSFASPAPQKSTAPGQLHFDEFKKLLSFLN